MLSSKIDSNLSPHTGGTKAEMRQVQTAEHRDYRTQDIYREHAEFRWTQTVSQEKGPRIFADPVNR